MKKSAVAVTCVLCILMLVATIFTVSVNAVNAAETEVYLTVNETASATIPEDTTQAVSEKSTPDEVPKENDSKSVQTGNAVCVVAGTVMLMSGFLTVWLERKRKND